MLNVVIFIASFTAVYIAIPVVLAILKVLVTLVGIGIIAALIIALAGFGVTAFFVKARDAG